MLSYILPRVLLSPISGYIVDNNNRKRMLFISEFGEVAVCLIIIASDILGRVTVPLVIMTNVFIGATESFRFPAYTAITTSLLDEADYAKAHGFYMLATALPAIIAPVSIGYFYDKLTFSSIYSMNLIGLLMAILLISLTKVDHVELATRTKMSFKFLFKDLKSSCLYIAKRKDLLSILLVCALFIFTYNTMNVLLPVIVLSSISDGSALLGTFDTLFGIGSLMGAVVVISLSTKICGVKRLLFFLCFAYLGMCMVSFPMFRIICVSGIMLQSIFNQLIDANVQSLWHHKVPINRIGQSVSIRRFLYG